MELPKGYEVSFVGDNLSKYECAICCCALKDPVQTRCGHRFCKECIEVYIRRGGKHCPNNCQPIAINELSVDNAAKREVLNLDIYCRNHRLGCRWTGPLRELEKHIKDCRPEEAKRSVQLNPLEKTKDITANIEQQMQAVHLTNEDNDAQEAKGESRLCAESSVLANFKHLEQKYAQMEKYFQYKLREMKIDIERLQEELVETKSNLALVNRLSLANGDFIWEVRNFNACLSDARCNLRDSMYSEAFSTGNPGYKLCVRVNLDGVDDRSRNYLSVYVHLMQGEYDNAMKWPFNRRIKISVLDRNPVRGERRNITDILSPQPNITALQRPKEWKSPQGYGFAKFVSISRLSSRYYLAGDILAIRIRVLS